jgi:hypothetical protein
MVTPWFAAGAGMVIAAAVAVDSPAALTYGPAAPTVRCSAHGCASPAPGGQPGLAAGSPGVPLQAPGAQAGGAAAASSGASRGAAAGSGAGYRLGYRIVSRRHGFVATITMPGDLKPGSWSLQFGFPSARIDRVWGALWRPSGDGNAGTALGPWEGRGTPPARTGARQVTVRASGTPTVPSGCTLDGIRCSFG